MINLKFCELHNALFLAGTNLQLKLDVSKRTGMKLMYDYDNKELYVFWNNEVAIIPSSNVSSMCPTSNDQLPAHIQDIMSAAKPPAPVKHIPATPGKPIKAQHSTPQDHVFKASQGEK